VAHDVCNDLLEHQLDTEAHVGPQTAAIERRAQREETLLKAAQRPGETQPGRVRVDAGSLLPPL
jgi:hypothetical protein